MLSIYFKNKKRASILNIFERSMHRLYNGREKVSNDYELHLLKQWQYIIRDCQFECIGENYKEILSYRTFPYMIEIQTEKFRYRLFL